MVKYKERLGEVRTNKYGTPMKIIEYNDANHMKVQFLDGNGHITSTKYEHFADGRVGNPYDKTVCGFGVVGIGKHKVSESGSVLKKYNHWGHIIDRCYSEKRKKSYYSGCSVCDDWRNYQNFGDWYDENYYEIDRCDMQLDKDILVKGNKIYSPDTSIFVPSIINVTFTKNDKGRGNLPIGVVKAGRKYASGCGSNYKRKRHLGTFDTPEEAFLEYKKAKEAYLKELADEYKTRIPEKLYNALINYEVEIDD